MLLYYTAHVKPTHSVFIPQYERRKRKAPLRWNFEKEEERTKNLKNNRVSGVLSKKAQGRIKNAINWLIMSAKRKRVYRKSDNSHFFFKVAFFTLTLPSKQVHSDDEIREIFSKFLTYARNRWKVINYVWRAEIQPKRLELRGERCIHFHVTTDTFIHKKELNRVWNLYLSKLGYVGGDASTEIHSVRSLNNLAGYLAKYMSKSEDELKGGEYLVKGKLWACSQSLSENATKLKIDIRYLNECYHRVKECATTEEKAIEKNGYSVGWLMLHKPINLRTRIEGELRKMIEDKMFFIRNDVQEYLFDDSPAPLPA